VAQCSKTMDRSYLCKICLCIDRELQAEIARISITKPNGFLIEHFTDELQAYHSFGDPTSSIERGASEGCCLCRLLRWALWSFLVPEADRLAYFPGYFEHKVKIGWSNFRTFRLWPTITRYNDKGGTPVLRQLHIRALPKMNLLGDRLLSLQCSEESGTSQPFGMLTPCIDDLSCGEAKK